MQEEQLDCNLVLTMREPMHRRSRQRRSGYYTCRVAVLLVCLLLLPWMAPVDGAHIGASRSMREHMRRFAAKIPIGTDYLGQLTDAQRTAWSHDIGYTINETVQALTEVKVEIMVNVKLVGFGGDGNEALHVADHDLQLYLRSLHNRLDTVALHPSPEHMMMKPEFVFRVMPAYYELAPKVAAAINQAINVGKTTNAFTPDYQLHLVPYQEVDKVIDEDFSHSDGSYTIYILNPPAHAPYAYIYSEEGNTTDSCPGSLYVSSKRYAWFDITSNLTFYGPGPGGKGQVFAHSTPVLQHYKKESMARALLPDLSALVWSACQHLMWPPLHHSKLAFNKNLEVHLIYMVDALQRPRPGNGRVNVQKLQEQLATVGQRMGQSVSVMEHFVMFAECDHCVTAYSGALKARTSRSAETKGFKLSVSHYLDLTELERWLSEWRDALLSEAGVNWDTDHGGPAVLPVFIFDVPSKEPVLLDGLLQAAVLGKGDVVAVRSAANPFSTFFGCFEHQMRLDPRNVHRAVLGAVLQQAYGVSDTAISWSPATGKSWNFLWSVGQTPFGALSNSASLSFVQGDAALRNIMLSYLNSSMIHAAHLIGGFEVLAPHGHMEHVKRYLMPDQVIPYNQRISLLLFKIKEAAITLAARNHDLAVGFAVSTMEDVAALHKITKQYKATLNPDLVCLNRNQGMRWWMIPAVCMFITLALTVWRCARGSDDGQPGMHGPGSRRGSLGGGHRGY